MGIWAAVRGHLAACSDCEGGACCSDCDGPERLSCRRLVAPSAKSLDSVVLTQESPSAAVRPMREGWGWCRAVSCTGPRTHRARRVVVSPVLHLVPRTCAAHL